MAKRQKGFQLPDEVIRWLEEEETRTGATLSRLALAAFCSYIQQGESMQTQFMRVAMAVERGQLKFTGIPERYAEHLVESIQCLVRFARERGDSDMAADFEKELEKARKQLVEMKKSKR